VKAASLAWAGLAAALVALALLAWRVEPTAIDWQPALALAQPWRAYSAVAVHYSGLHLAANAAGAALVAALGLAARVSQCSVWAWFVALMTVPFIPTGVPASEKNVEFGVTLNESPGGATTSDRSTVY